MIGKIGEALVKIATLTSVVRTRREDVDRFERHDGVASDLHDRFEVEGTRLATIARRLERTLD